MIYSLIHRVQMVWGVKWANILRYSVLHKSRRTIQILSHLCRDEIRVSGSLTGQRASHWTVDCCFDLWIRDHGLDNRPHDYRNNHLYEKLPHLGGTHAHFHSCSRYPSKPTLLAVSRLTSPYWKAQYYGCPPHGFPSLFSCVPPLLSTAPTLLRRSSPLTGE